MAPMDKYTRLVGGAVHGLSCFHSAQCFFFFFAPVIKPGNNGSDSEKTRLSQMLPSDHTTRKRKWEDCNGVSGDSSLFWLSV